MERNYFGQARTAVDEASTCLDEIETQLTSARDHVVDAYQLIDRAQSQKEPMSREARRAYANVLREIASSLEGIEWQS